jgi:nicotinamidase-related amidase
MKNLGILVIDMQEDFFELIKEKEKLGWAQNRLLNLAKEKKILIFILKYQGRGGELIPKFKKILEEENSYFILKNHCDGFKKNPALTYLLKRMKIKNLILTGIYAGACVLETAKGAKNKGINVFTSDMLMNRRYESDTNWYKKNTNYHENLAELLTTISDPNL